MASREEVIKNLKRVWVAFDNMEHELYADYVYDALELLEKPQDKPQDEPRKFIVSSDGKITPLPEEKHGHWIDKGHGEYRCSECNDMLYFRDGSPSTEGYRYCPYCGARMKARMK